MSNTIPSVTLTHKAVLTMLNAAADKAEEIGQPQCVVIVDASGETLGSIKMTGAKYLSLHSARTKARTSASTGNATGGMPEEFAAKLAAATQNRVTNLPGGLPIRFDGVLAGAIGVGSGTGDQDIEVGKAALAAIGAD